MNFSAAKHIQMNAPALTPAKQAGAKFIYPGRTEGWVNPTTVYILAKILTDFQYSFNVTLSS